MDNRRSFFHQRKAHGEGLIVFACMRHLDTSALLLQASNTLRCPQTFFEFLVSGSLLFLAAFHVTEFVLEWRSNKLFPQFDSRFTYVARHGFVSHCVLLKSSGFRCGGEIPHLRPGVWVSGHSRITLESCPAIRRPPYGVNLGSLSLGPSVKVCDG